MQLARKLAKKKIYIILAIILSIGIYLYLNFLRNEWYLNFYKAIETRNNINQSVIIFLIIACAIILNDFIKGLMKTKFISQARKKNFTQQIKNNENDIENDIDYAQRICEDQRFSAEYFINAIDEWLMGIGIICIFVPHMFFLIGANNYSIMLILIGYSSLLFLFNFGYIKKLLQTKLYQFEENEGKLRNFLSIWLNKHAVRPINFSWNYFTLAKKNMEKYFTTKLLINAIQSLYENIGLIIPFIAFYNLYASNKISFPSLFQLINLWTNINFAIKNIAKGIENYICYDITKKRLKNILENVSENISGNISESAKNGDENIVHKNNENIELKNITIIIKQKNHSMKIIENFWLQIQKGQRVNIVAKNGMGKTTLMRAMQNMIKYDGTILVPEKTIWIPEQPIITPNFIQEIDNKKFQDNCKIMNLNLNGNPYENLSGAEKWKTIAAYAMCFEYIVWDDPFWGISNDDYIQTFLENTNTVLIFSQTPIDNMKIETIR